MTILKSGMSKLSTNNIKIINDDSLCRDCQPCTLGCSLFHFQECNPTKARLQILKNMAEYKFNIIICRQCEDPECVAPCPNESIKIDDRGVIIIDQDECIRCGACADACPYHAIFYNKELDQYLKCDLCAGREGRPVCTEVCPVGALTLSVHEIEEV